MPDLVPRMRALEHAIHDAGASRREEFPGGVAYYNDDLPLVWDVNFVRVDQRSGNLVQAVEQLQSEQDHIKVLIEDPLLVEAHGPELIGRGLSRRGLVALARSPGGVFDADVSELHYQEVRDFRFAIHMEQLVPPREDVAEQVGRVHDRTFELTGERWFVIHVDGRAAGHLIVYPGDGVAQIEDVGVLKRYRGRGLARRLIEHALAVIAEDGHDTAFICAETDDFPHAFYKRLGFEHVEDRADFLLIKAA